MIKLIASDMDGTLLRDAGHVDERAMDLIRKYTAQGAVFTPASGRCAASCRALFNRAGFPLTHCIGVNGAQVQNCVSGETHYMRPLPLETARRAFEIMQSENLHICIYARELIAYTWEQAISTSPEQRIVEEMAALGVESAVGEEAVARAMRGPVLKMYADCAHGTDREAFERAREACAALEGVTITNSWMNNFELMPAGVDKGAALLYLAERLGVRREEIVAFGDGCNDESMLRAAGIGVAMAHGDESAKAAADCTAESVAAWLEENEALFQR